MIAYLTTCLPRCLQTQIPCLTSVAVPWASSLALLFPHLRQDLYPDSPCLPLDHHRLQNRQRRCCPRCGHFRHCSRQNRLRSPHCCGRRCGGLVADRVSRHRLHRCCHPRPRLLHMCDACWCCSWVGCSFQSGLGGRDCCYGMAGLSLNLHN